MGKSVLLRLVMTHIYISTEGSCELYICDNKVTDVHMFQGLKGVRIAETAGEAKMYFSDILAEGHRRKEFLKAKGDVVDVKSYRAKYPDDEPMPPVFVIIDEYGRFAEDKEIQAQVTEIAETLGYLDFHLVVASQRPDAATVLKPRIKANLLTRIAFTTTDEYNSKIILDLPDAAKLGKVKGRAILLDGFPEKIQVPYMSEEQAVALLSPYRGVVNDSARQEIDSIPEALPSFVAGPFGQTDLPGSGSPARNDQPNRKKTRKGRMDSPDSPS
jgi:DNA segregation ATPase FtsK/SpoIIIE-like protein